MNFIYINYIYIYILSTVILHMKSMKNLDGLSKFKTK